MKEISQETLDHIPDPIAKLVWEKWIAEGKARLIPVLLEGSGRREKENQSPGLQGPGYPRADPLLGVRAKGQPVY